MRIPHTADTPRPSSHGVTILELVMVVFVIGLILGLTVPLASALAGRFRVGSARDVFVNYHARARAVAVQYGREARLRIEAQKGEFWVEVDTGRAGSIGVDTLGTVMNIASEYGGVTMFSDGREVLCYDNRGLPVNRTGCDGPDAEIRFARSDKEDTVRISLGGTVVQR